MIKCICYKVGDILTVEVLVEIKAKRIDQTFTYKVPSHLESQIEIGKRVLVPFGKQKLEGFVLKKESNKKVEYELKEIIEIIDDYPVINEEMLELGQYISKKTLSTLISAYQAMLPKALKAKKGFNVNKKIVTYLTILNKNYLPKNKSQAQILNLFIDDNKVLKKEATDISASALKTLISHNVIEENRKEAYRINMSDITEECNITLNEEQQKVVDIVNNSLNEFIPFLLYGVTGSGKTEVYMHIIKEVLKQNKEVIVLVPEISLTPQIVNLFKKRFGSKIAILHSRLNDGEKYDEWRKIEKKEVSIVIGARSAIFAPFTNLGLIIIDEEHTNTYKQENNPRYNAIDIALYRAKKYKIPVILGSATPQIESYTRSKQGIYKLLEITKRVNNNLPKVELIDMKEEIKKGNKVISTSLYNAIKNRLEKKEQIILLLNRRGYSTIVTCHSCGYIDKCPNCDIPLTYHKKINKMKCHYCNYEKKVLTTCPECQKEDLWDLGIGTEKLEQIIKEMFNDAKIIRMDVDTTSLKGAHEKIINAFQNKEYDILIGTQMIAKGLDFPNVTLVGVVNGDATLNIPDFRSAERTFQLLNQVAGRAGRGNKIGNVIIQGFNINHYSIVTASHHDYISFYNQEMKLRKELVYPPFCNLALIKIIASDFAMANTEGQKIVKFLKNKTNNTIILGPSTATIPKINNKYYLQIIIKYKKTEDIYRQLEYLNNHYKMNNKLNIEFCLNPLRI